MAQLRAAPVAAKPAALATAGGVQSFAGVELPEISTMDGSFAMPSICVRGVSGTGKTEGIRHMLHAGKNVLVVAIEDKVQSLLKYEPAVLYLGAPVVERATGAKRPPTPTEMYNRIMAFVDRLASGEFREHKGKPFDLIAGDGIMEVGRVFERHFKAHYPQSKTGERNAFALYDEIGNRLVDFFARVRGAASAASQLYDIPPMGTYWTIGEAEATKPGQYGYKVILPGNIAPLALPFQFEAIFRLVIRKGEDGRPVYVMQTVGEESNFEAKCPGGVLEPEVMNWDMNTVYDTLRAHYQRKETN